MPLDTRGAAESGARAHALARSLLRAGDIEDCLRAWLTNVSPDADLAVLLGGDDPVPQRAFRRAAGAWAPLALPPAGLGRSPSAAVSLSLGSERRSALEDLLYSMSLERAVLLPLGAAGLLLLARAGRRFSEEEVAGFERSAPLLGDAITHHERIGLRFEQQAGGGVEEIAALFELNRQLARAVDEVQAFDAVENALSRLLRPACGGMRFAGDSSGPPRLRSWPAGPLGGAAATAASGGRPAGLAHWVVSSPDDVALRIALGWNAAPPPAALRVVQSAQASLKMAVERLESQRLKEEARLLRAMRGLPLGVVLLSSRGRVRLANPAARVLLESLDAWPGGDGRLLRIGSVKLGPMIAGALAGRPGAAEVFLPGNLRTLELRVVPAAENEGEALLVLEDVTESRRQKRQLAQAEKLSALGELIAGVVHELNNPLSTILGYAQMLVGMPDAPARSKWIDTILGEGQRCHRIVNNMLSLARSHGEGGEMVSLGAIAEKALSLISYPFRTAGIEASLRVDNQAPAVRGDADGLLQVLINLLTNSMHVLEQREGRREVRVEIEVADEDHLRLVVSDSGPGVPPELREKVFEPFFTTKGEGKGTGLGLSQVATTVREHGGTITIDDARGGGARFVIDLPRTPEAVAELPRETPVVLPVESALSGLRLVVVDDEPSVADCLAEYLRHAGAEVEQIHDGEEGLERLRRGDFDAAICDLRMPRLGGRQIAARLEEEAPELARRLIFSTGDIEALGADAAEQGLGGPCLSKPFDFQQVLSAVQQVATARG